MNLWPHQEKAHLEIIEAFRNKEIPLLVMPTGSGKTITVGSFIDKYKEHFKFVFIVRTRGLVFQTQKSFTNLGIESSILMSGEEFTRKEIIICSKDTLQARNLLPFEFEEDVIYIWDEADETPEYQVEVLEKIKHNPRAFFMGMTATPYRELSHYTKAIIPTTAKKLRDEGVLVPFDYIVPKKINFRDIEIENGAFKSKDLLKKLDTPKAYSEAINAFLEFGESRQCLVFCSSTGHGKRFTEALNDYYGNDVAAYCDADTEESERQNKIQDFRNGRLKFLVNIRLFTRGTDIPEIGCILDLASTLSLNLIIQKWGRGTRKNLVYKDCKIIDIANNCLIHGHFYQDREIDLTSSYKKGRKDIEDLMMRVCEKCFRPSEVKDFGFKNICPYCGIKNKPIKEKKKSKYSQDKLFLETASEEQIEQKQLINEYKKILWQKRNLGRRYQIDIAIVMAHKQLIKKYGLEKIMKIKNAIGLEQKTIDDLTKNQYVPLGGMEI